MGGRERELFPTQSKGGGVRRGVIVDWGVELVLCCTSRGLWIDCSEEGAHTHCQYITSQARRGKKKEVTQKQDEQPMATYKHQDQSSSLQIGTFS